MLDLSAGIFIIVINYAHKTFLSIHLHSFSKRFACTWLFKFQVTGCWYKQANVRVSMFATVRIPAPFFRGGGQNVFYFL